MKSWDDADPAAATVYAASEHRDITATVVVPRPRTAEQWSEWHARRDAARAVIAKVRSASTVVDQDTITRALGLDPDGEADLLDRWK